MSKRDDGGSAFPSSKLDTDGPYDPQPGMSLRDYFAAQALQAIDVQAHVAYPAAEKIAASAYAIADAMIAERSKP